MEFDLQVGESLLETAVRVTNIQMDLQPVVDAITEASNLISSESVYEGSARPELEMFYFQYLMNVNKLIYYYSLASRFVPMVIDEMISLDSSIAALTDDFEKDQAKAAIMSQLAMSLTEKMIA